MTDREDMLLIPPLVYEPLPAPPGAWQDIRRRATRTRRVRRAAPVLAVVSAVALGSVPFVLQASGRSEAAPAGLDMPYASTPRADARDEPSFLPPGAWLARRASLPNGGLLLEYRLPGRANANTFPPEGVTAANAKTVHPETLLVLRHRPELKSRPRSTASPAYFDTVAVTVSGLPALLTTAKNGAGLVRLDWLDHDGYRALEVDRLVTPEGMSGIDTTTLLRVANSLYGDN